LLAVACMSTLLKSGHKDRSFWAVSEGKTDGQLANCQYLHLNVWCHR
jgi:hypothetical protein